MSWTSRSLIGLVLFLVAAALGCFDGSTVPDLISECGGFEGIPCPGGQTCELPAGQCTTSDLAGICVPIPEACTADFNPVCGCDGVTYSNDCTRLMARVQKDRDGECES